MGPREEQGRREISAPPGPTPVATGAGQSFLVCLLLSPSRKDICLIVPRICQIRDVKYELFSECGWDWNLVIPSAAADNTMSKNTPPDQ